MQTSIDAAEMQCSQAFQAIRLIYDKCGNAQVYARLMCIRDYCVASFGVSIMLCLRRTLVLRIQSDNFVLIPGDLNSCQLIFSRSDCDARNDTMKNRSRYNIKLQTPNFKLALLMHYQHRYFTLVRKLLRCTCFAEQLMKE